MTTLVFGLDGGNWNLVDPWIESGALPTLERLKAEGIWGVSESVLPPVTCPNWKCYASSRSPGHHDVYWWEKIDKETLDLSVPDSRSFTAPELWDYCNDEGLSAGVMNLPMSYPPRKIDDFMVAGGPRSRETEFTEPPELEGELTSEGYTVHPRQVVTSNDDPESVEATLELIQKRFDAAARLLEEREPDFLHLTIFHLNVLQHYYWNDEPVKRAWQCIDENLARFLDEGHTIFLMSDHGCDGIETVFHVNEWLQEQGYLSMETSFADYLLRVGITQERLASIVRAFNLESTLRKHLPRRLIERFPDSEGIKRDNKFDKLDEHNSDAIASGQGLIYVLHDPGTPAYEETIDSIMDELAALRSPAGTPVASTVYRGDELYPDGDPTFRPDVVFDQGPGLHTSGAVGTNAVFDTPNRWAAENVRGGLFLAHGETVAETGNFGQMSILDIAPTVLYAMGLDVPTDFEGEPIEAANTERDEVTTRPPLAGRGSAGEDANSEAVEERLSDLGYLS